MKKNLIEDISKLSTIRQSIIRKLVKIAEYCISDYILESKFKDSDMTEVDIGIGKLQFCIDDESLKYAFIPSNRLEKMIVEAYQSEKSQMTDKIEDNLERRLLSAYKELL